MSGDALDEHLLRCSSESDLQGVGSQVGGMTDFSGEGGTNEASFGGKPRGDGIPRERGTDTGGAAWPRCWKGLL